MASPEEFAEVYTQELGLGGEFKYVFPSSLYIPFFFRHHDSRFFVLLIRLFRVSFCPTRTAIAHSIREQVQTYQKSLFLVGHPSDGTAVQDEELKQSFLPSLVSGARPVSEVQQFTPILNYLSDGELERTERERDKDLNKRRKRNTRGRRGIALPDREPIRTYRTPAIGFPELDAATLALAAAANAPMSRRAAAAAASLTIANMVASENGTAFMPQTMPSAAVPQAPTAASKEKPKGLFKAPSYPNMVLRPRALVTAPTMSTAADVSSMPPVPADNEAPPSSSSAAAPALDSKVSKIISAKRAKELEREAKEKEFVDGQHPNYIDGVWHCSNCGCPESIAVGRRKGPLGDKSQCGTCGASCSHFILPFSNLTWLLTKPFSLKQANFGIGIEDHDLWNTILTLTSIQVSSRRRSMQHGRLLRRRRGLLPPSARRVRRTALHLPQMPRNRRPRHGQTEMSKRGLLAGRLRLLRQCWMTIVRFRRCQRPQVPLSHRLPKE